MLAGFRQKKAQLEVARRRGREETYTEPLLNKDGHKKSQEDLEDIKKFLFDFYKSIYKRRPELNVILEQYPNTVGMFFQKLVPAQVTFEDFWQRYFYRCDEARVVRELERQFEQARQARTEAISEGVESVKNLWGSSTQEGDDLNAKKHGEPTVAKTSPRQAASSKSELVPQSAAPKAKTVSPRQLKNKSSSGDEEITFEDTEQPRPRVSTPSRKEQSKSVTKSNKKARAVIPTTSASQPAESAQPTVTKRGWFGGKKSSSSSSSTGKTPPPPPPSRETSSVGDQQEMSPQERTILFKRALFQKTRALAPKPSPEDSKKQRAAKESKSSKPLKGELSGAAVGVLAVSMIVVLVAILYGLNPDLRVSTVDSLCTPARPGRTLGGSEDDLSLEAPWWVPMAGKPTVFELVCGDRVRTRLDWTFVGYVQERGDTESTIHKLALLALLDDSETGAARLTRFFEKQNLKTATIYSKHIALQDKREVIQNMVWPWTKG